MFLQEVYVSVHHQKMLRKTSFVCISLDRLHTIKLTSVCQNESMFDVFLVTRLINFFLIHVATKREHA